MRASLSLRQTCVCRGLLPLARHEPPVVSSGPAFRRWMCRMHNHVNARLGKPPFNCDFVEARWQALDCGEERGCDLTPLGGKRSSK